jgi:hypothetical protein
MTGTPARGISSTTRTVAATLITRPAIAIARTAISQRIRSLNMPACNFTVFVDKVRSGEKCQTVRPGHRFKVGDMMYCYTGMRTKRCRKLNQGRVYEVIGIYWGGLWFGGDMNYLEILAKRDGFDSYGEMSLWFQKHYPEPTWFQIIRWIPERITHDAGTV